MHSKPTARTTLLNLARALACRCAMLLEPVWFGFLRLRWVAAGILMVAFVVSVKHLTEQAQPQPAEELEPVPQLPEAQAVQWVTDGGTPALMLASLATSNLPEPGKGQVNREAECEPPARWVEGGCWLLVGEEVPPCAPPPGKPRRLWPHNGKCWMPVPRTARAPTSGDPRTGGVAEP